MVSMLAVRFAGLIRAASGASPSAATAASEQLNTPATDTSSESSSAAPRASSSPPSSSPSSTGRCVVHHDGTTPPSPLGSFRSCVSQSPEALAQTLRVDSATSITKAPPTRISPFTASIVHVATAATAATTTAPVVVVLHWKDGKIPEALRQLHTPPVVSDSPTTSAAAKLIGKDVTLLARGDGAPPPPPPSSSTSTFSGERHRPLLCVVRVAPFVCVDALNPSQLLAALGAVYEPPGRDYSDVDPSAASSSAWRDPDVYSCTVVDVFHCPAVRTTTTTTSQVADDTVTQQPHRDEEEEASSSAEANKWSALDAHSSLLSWQMSPAPSHPSPPSSSLPEPSSSSSPCPLAAPDAILDALFRTLRAQLTLPPSLLVPRAPRIVAVCDSSAGDDMSRCISRWRLARKMTAAAARKSGGADGRTPTHENGEQDASGSRSCPLDAVVLLSSGIGGFAYRPLHYDRRDAAVSSSDDDDDATRDAAAISRAPDTATTGTGPGLVSGVSRREVEVGTSSSSTGDDDDDNNNNNGEARPAQDRTAGGGWLSWLWATQRPINPPGERRRRRRPPPSGRPMILTDTIRQHSKVWQAILTADTIVWHSLLSTLVVSGGGGHHDVTAIPGRKAPSSSVSIIGQFRRRCLEVARSVDSDPSAQWTRPSRHVLATTKSEFVIETAGERLAGMTPMASPRHWDAPPRQTLLGEGVGASVLRDSTASSPVSSSAASSPVSSRRRGHPAAAATTAAAPSSAIRPPTSSSSSTTTIHKKAAEGGGSDPLSVDDSISSLIAMRRHVSFGDSTFVVHQQDEGDEEAEGGRGGNTTTSPSPDDDDDDQHGGAEERRVGGSRQSAASHRNMIRRTAAATTAAAGWNDVASPAPEGASVAGATAVTSTSMPSAVALMQAVVSTQVAASAADRHRLRASFSSASLKRTVSGRSFTKSSSSSSLTDAATDASHSVPSPRPSADATSTPRGPSSAQQNYGAIRTTPQTGDAEKEENNRTMEENDDGDDDDDVTRQIKEDLFRESSSDGRLFADHSGHVGAGHGDDDALGTKRTAKGPNEQKKGTEEGGSSGRIVPDARNNVRSLAMPTFSAMPHVASMPDWGHVFPSSDDMPECDSSSTTIDPRMLLGQRGEPRSTKTTAETTSSFALQHRLDSSFAGAGVPLTPKTPFVEETHGALLPPPLSSSTSNATEDRRRRLSPTILTAAAAQLRPNGAASAGAVPNSQASVADVGASQQQHYGAAAATTTTSLSFATRRSRTHEVDSLFRASSPRHEWLRFVSAVDDLCLPCLFLHGHDDPVLPSDSLIIDELSQSGERGGDGSHEDDVLGDPLAGASWKEGGGGSKPPLRRRRRHDGYLSRFVNVIVVSSSNGHDGWLLTSGQLLGGNHNLLGTWVHCAVAWFVVATASAS